MPAEKQSFTPIPLLASILGLRGTAKLIDARPVPADGDGWVPSPWRRRGIGVIELGIAWAALKGLEDATCRRLAGAGTLATMAGALGMHLRAGDGALRLVAPVLTGALGAATYLDLTLDVEP